MNRTQQTLVIAEAGVNHNGDLQIAKKLVDAAAKAGADVVKFQTFQANQLATERAEQAVYQQQALGQSQGQLAMLQGKAVVAMGVRLEGWTKHFQRQVNGLIAIGMGVYLNPRLQRQMIDF